MLATLRNRLTYADMACPRRVALLVGVVAITLGIGAAVAAGTAQAAACVPGGSCTLSVSVKGSGTVTSSPAGINCQPDCSEAYDHDDSVTLTASPAPGWRLRAWGGECAAAGSNSTCALDMTDNRSVTATFVYNQLYVSPGGSAAATAPCTEAEPCEIETAVESVAEDFDDVVVLPGDYALSSTISAPGLVDIRGAGGQPRPRLVGSTGGSLLQLHDSRLDHIQVENTGSGAAVEILLEAEISGLVAIAGSGSALVTGLDGVFLRDSVLRTTGSGGEALMAFSDGQLRNVTAISTGSSSRGIVADVAIAETTLDLKNVIARGAGGGSDLTATADEPGETVAVNVAYSNYQSTAQNSSGGGSATIVDQGNNQTAPPLFADPANGDFHQLAGSPTIDAGTADPLNGPTDLDGDPRTLGGRPDIGADEFVPTAGGGGGAGGGGSGAGSSLLPGDCANLQTGTNGANTLTGTPLGDRLLGLVGNDVLVGGDGNDCLDGGAGNDRLSGQVGDDTLSGGPGKDRLSGGPGKNRYSAGSGNDRVSAANRVRETVNCGRGRDSASVDRRDRVRGCERVRRKR